MRGFSAAQVPTLKALVAWVSGLGGLTLALMLLLTGHGPVSLFALLLLGPLVSDQWREKVAPQINRTARRPPPRRPPPPPPRPPDDGRMTREEAYQVLGLAPGAGEAEIRAAWVRLMRAAHPDNGGSDWLAARVNAARDTLLGPGGRRR
jgi:hypothetical protein